jgi:hypothetical protein
MPVQHWMFDGPGQRSAVDVPPSLAHCAVSMQVPVWPVAVTVHGP